MIDWRYPDKPYPCTPEMLAELDHHWIAETKCDGWRCIIHVDDEIRAHTQKHMRLSRALRRDDDFEPELAETLRGLQLPKGCVLDGEFMGRRVVDAIEHEHLWLFDLHFLDYKWTGGLPLYERKDILWGLIRGGQLKHEKRLGFVHSVRGDLLQFYENQSNNPLSEGVVCKRLDSTLIGDVTKVRDNPDWLKCKFRV